MTSVLEYSADSGTMPLPIVSVCVVSDKNKAPKGFQPIAKCHDDQSDADLWRDGFLAFSRSVRYICVSREIPESSIPGSLSVVTNMVIVKDSDPIPFGYVAIDYTADSREKSLRKKYICVRTEPRERVVDAIGDIIILARNKKVPKDYTEIGDIDSLLLCTKVVTIPQTFGMTLSASTSQLPDNIQTGLYPGLSPSIMSQSTSALGPPAPTNDAFTMKFTAMPKMKGIDGIDWKINPKFAGSAETSSSLDEYGIDRLIIADISYDFSLEKSVLAGGH